MAFQPVSDIAMAKLWFQLHLRGGTCDFWSVSSDSKYFIPWLCVTLCNVLDVYLVTMQPLLASHQCEIRIKPRRRFMKAIQRPVFHLLLLLLQFAVIPCAMCYAKNSKRQSFRFYNRSKRDNRWTQMWLQGEVKAEGKAMLANVVGCVMAVQ